MPEALKVGATAWRQSLLFRPLGWMFWWPARRLDGEVLAFGDVFRGRLPNDVVDDAVEYVGFNERRLAIEILAEQLGEYDVSLTPDEWKRLIQLYETSGGDPTSRRVFSQLEPRTERRGLRGP
jgi:hypothetical protein